MRKDIPHKNLFSGDDTNGATTDGTVPGLSEWYEGHGEPLHINLINPDRAHIGLMVREVPEHVDSELTHSWVLHDNQITNCPHERRTVFFEAGFQYAFMLFDVGGGRRTPTVHLNSIADNAYESYQYWRHHEWKDEGWNCNVANDPTCCGPVYEPCFLMPKCGAALDCNVAPGCDCPDQLFQWSSGNASGRSYQLCIGSFPGGDDIHKGAVHTDTYEVVSGLALPFDRKFYATIKWSDDDGCSWNEKTCAMGENIIETEDTVFLNPAFCGTETVFINPAFC